MKLTDDQRKRGVGTNIRLWLDTNGEIHIPYEIDGSKSKGGFQLKEYTGFKNKSLHSKHVITRNFSRDLIPLAIISRL